MTSKKIGWWRRCRDRTRRAHPVIGVPLSLGILLTAALVYLALVEIAARVALRVPIFAFRDFRHERAAGTINKAIDYDTVLGWRLKPHIKSKGFNTLDHGFFALTTALTPKCCRAACWRSAPRSRPAPR